MKLAIRTIVFLIFFLITLINAQDNTSTKSGVLWKFKTNGKIYSTPLVHNNVVYVGSYDGKFYAVNKNDGKKIWEYDTGSPILSTAVISENTIMFESGYELYFLDLQGKLIRKKKFMQYEVLTQMDAWDFHHSSPVVDGKNVYIGAPFGGVLGYEIATGDSVLQIVTKNRAIVRTTPIIKNGTIYFGDWDGVFFSYDVNTGKENWSYDTRNDTTFAWTNAVHEKPIIVNDKIYFAGRSCMIYCLDAKTGKKIWSHISENSGWLVGGPTYSNGKVYLGSSNEYIIQCFEAENGKKLWEQKLDHRIWGNPLIKNDNIVIGAGSLFILDKFTGKTKKVLIKKDDIKLAKTEFVWKQYKGKDILASFHSSPVENDGVIYIGCDDGYLYSVNLK